MSEKNYLLQLSTAMVEPEKFTIDGEEYDFLGLEHLSDVQESEVLALFAQHTRLSNELAFAPNVNAGQKIASKLREIRVRILAILTTVPKKQLDDYNVNVHAALMSMAEKVMNPEAEETGAEDDAL